MRIRTGRTTRADKTPAEEEIAARRSKNDSRATDRPCGFYYSDNSIGSVSHRQNATERNTTRASRAGPCGRNGPTERKDATERRRGSVLDRGRRFKMDSRGSGGREGEAEEEADTTWPPGPGPGARPHRTISFCIFMGSTTDRPPRAIHPHPARYLENIPC